MTIWSDSGASTSREWVRRYLAVLGLEETPPSLTALAALTRAHVLKLPFENITAIRRRAAHPEGPVPPLDAEALLANWEQEVGGGVCFELAPMFARLIESLGYRASLVQGQITFPGSHQCVLVDLDDARYFADVGNGAPFFDPIPLAGAVEIHHFGLFYRFRPGESSDQWLQERLIHGSWEPFCRYDLRPAGDDAFATAYQAHHTPGQSWVVDRLRVIRIRENELLTLFENEFTRFAPDSKHSEIIPDSATLQLVVRNILGLPGLPTSQYLASRADLFALPSAT